MRRLVRLFALLAGATACLPVASAAALPFPVTSTADSGGETLRWAIEEANDRPGADSIPIEVTGTINLEDALPTIEEDVSIVGPGADSLTIRRNSVTALRILNFSSNMTTAFVSGLTVSNGLAESGGGISNGTGSLTLTSVVVSGNEALAVGGFGAVSFGGGIYSSGPLTLRDSTVWGNTVTAEKQDFFLEARGGGIYAEGPLTVERSTIAENEARALEGFEEMYASGGGIQGYELTLTSSTITGNSVAADSAESGGSALGANLAIAATSLVRNTIVAEPEGADSCSKPLTSGGFNLDEDSSCKFEAATDLDAVDPLLGPLADNGGTTPTHALLPGSAAIDRGNAFESSVDQRGLLRPVDFLTVSNAEGGDGSDIGAFEVQAPLVPVPGPVHVSPTPADTQAPNTRIVIAPPRVTYKRLAEFRFASTEPQSTFQCKVDNRQWRGCSNPFKRRVKPGKHLFRVRAIDRFGNVDPSPARFGWRVKPLS